MLPLRLPDAFKPASARKAGRGHSSLIIHHHHSSFIIYCSTFIINHSSLIINSSSIIHHSSSIMYPSPFLIIINHHSSSFIIIHLHTSSFTRASVRAAAGPCSPHKSQWSHTDELKTAHAAQHLQLDPGRNVVGPPTTNKLYDLFVVPPEFEVSFGKDASPQHPSKSPKHSHDPQEIRARSKTVIQIQILRAFPSIAPKAMVVLSHCYRVSAAPH